MNISKELPNKLHICNELAITKPFAKIKSHHNSNSPPVLRKSMSTCCPHYCVRRCLKEEVNVKWHHFLRILMRRLPIPRKKTESLWPTRRRFHFIPSVTVLKNSTQIVRFPRLPNWKKLLVSLIACATLMAFLARCFVENDPHHQ